jgi:hypothetical protein
MENQLQRAGGVNLMRFNEADTGNQPAASIHTLEGFNRLLNEQPDEKEIKTNKFAGNSKYLPISFVQMKLDELFVGLWKTKDFSFEVVANELIGRVTLEYFHPFAKMWITREGAAAVMIQQSAGADLTDISAKIKNTLGKDHPHLLASCTCSAARTIGKVFGRDINRKEEDNYESYYTNIAESESAIDAIDWTKVKTKADLKAVWDAHPNLHENKNFQKSFTYKKNQLVK